ncbi:uncharacterized protein LOC116602070 [Nematostella vectensis]|uniref:uncharacterized protein LOC116602070 n=1 Tax=Nematostella vectensis TaxID=45351 RepID=UPI0020775358|nr:uncharacterized protein LOC116602070 [Nematostella vectensis]
MVDKNPRIGTPELRRKDFLGLQTARNWGSAPDINKLPPLNIKDVRKSKTRQINRPPTPSPQMRGKHFNLFGSSQRTRNLSPSSKQRLDLSLDLQPLVKGGGFVNGLRQSLAEAESPRLSVRSLPSSPVLPRNAKVRNRNPAKRLNSDSEAYLKGKLLGSKDEHIMKWIRDVESSQEDLFAMPSTDTAECGGDARTSISSSDSRDQDTTSATPTLPVINEGDGFDSLG